MSFQHEGKGQDRNAASALILDFDGPLRPVAEPAFSRNQTEHRNDGMFDGFPRARAIFPMRVRNMEMTMAEIEVIARHRKV
jgi:hypothetical protein